MRYVVIVMALISFNACKKKTEIVEVEKKYSWTESKRFTGTEKFFLSSGSDGKTIFLQQPFFFTTLTNQNEHSGITVYGAGLPTDVAARIPISPTFSAFAVSDTILKIINNLNPVAFTSNGYINLKTIDPTLVSIQRRNSLLFKIMSINDKGTLLLTYENNQPTHPYTFMLLKVKTMPDYPFIDTLFSKLISIPRSISTFAYVRHFTAIDDYFLADISNEGLYKIKEDGSFYKVFSSVNADAFYQWQGKVYAHVEPDKLLVSADTGNSWQEYSGIPSAIIVNNSYYKIKDSLVGANHDNLFTLKWNDTKYSLRALKNDGLEGSTINGVEILNDTVYAATTKGLFFKPLAIFFNGK